jgi:acetoin utilization protein AcuC
LTVELMHAYGLIAKERPAVATFALASPYPASDAQLLSFHDSSYIFAVKHGQDDADALARHGIGPGDTPWFADMHNASARIVGASCAAVDIVLAGRAVRAFAPAGGLHHAHRDHAAGFCVYNDVAVAISSAIARDPGLRVAYVDIDAHHGDGVQNAFYAEPRVLTVSLHEDGRYIFPGTGSYRERGAGKGLGTSVNVPMPPYATPECYLLAFDRVVAPAVRAFAPDLLVTQNGGDAHWSDPLTSLSLTLDGYEALFRRLVALAEELTGGRIVALGGGGYSWLTVVPRIWTLLAATLLNVSLPEVLPAPWPNRVRSLGVEPPAGLHADDGAPPYPEAQTHVLHDTEHVIARLLAG